MEIWHMNGAGNDFAVVDARDKDLDMCVIARELCKKIGCDGFMALDRSDIADFKLNFYNEDGSRAEMCGNGARCICRFAYDNGIAGDKMTVETDAGIIKGERIGENLYRIKMNTPKDIMLDKAQGIDYCIIGVPHLVIELSELDLDMPDKLFDRARALRNEFNANVNFYSKLDENTVKILTYERGVEDFTLACGTGSCAVAVILCSKGKLNGKELTVKNCGGDLAVTVMTDIKEITEIYLQGNVDIDMVYKY